MNHKLESRLQGEISITSDTQMTHTLAESEEELKSLSFRVKVESEKAGLQLNILKPKIISTSRQIKEEKVSFNLLAAVTIYSDFGPQENKACHCFQCFSIYLP